MKKYLLALVMLLAVSVSVPFVTYAEGTQNAHVHEMEQCTVTPTTGNHSIKFVMIEEPTCIYGGYAEEYCINCGLITAEMDMAPTDKHTYGYWKTVSEATADIEGKEERSCKVCGQKQYRSVSKLEKKISKDEQNAKKVTIPFFEYWKKMILK